MNEKGFSLVELLVAMAIASVLGMAGVALFSSSNWMYKRNEDVSEAQQNVRVAMEWLAKDIRTAGFGLDDPPASLTFTSLSSTFVGQSGGSITLSSPITVSNNSTGPDTITILGIGYEWGKLQNGVTTCDNGIAPNLNGANCIHLDDVSKFFKDDGSFDTNRKYINLGGELYVELATSGHDQTNGNLKLSSPAIFDSNRAAGTQIYIIQAVQYTIANNLTGCSTTNPCLASYDATGLRDSGRQMVAESIEDLQFAYGIAVSSTDWEVDDTKDGTAGYASTDFLSSPTDTSIVAVRANVVAKTRNVDMKGGKFRKQCVEDRSTDTTYCTNAAPDGYRRRLLTKMIKLRNPRAGGS